MRTSATTRQKMPCTGVPVSASTTASIQRRGLLATAAALMAGRAAHAVDALPAPSGPVVLSISGRVGRPNTEGSADLDMAMVAALAQHSFHARTPWYAQRRKFTGPLLRDVLHMARAEGSTLRLHALNDYRVDMPMDDTRRFEVIVARLLDDQPMAVRDKGPLFVVYPFDDVPALRSAIYYGRSAWQLRRIEVL
jgi:hypothetical protein